ncbi:MAG TPA: phage integrase SAM-like domain-containing protein [Flavobacterium sp.]|nr:phage integrase SAM-like domain-containing protein [Flavobacterium sp.]
MASIKLLLQSKNNPAVIYIRLRDGRNTDVKAKTNYHIDPELWDSKEQRPSKKALKNIDYANLDTDLQEIKNNLLKEYNKSKGVVAIDLNWLNDFINPPQQEEKLPEKLIDYLDKYTEYKKREVKESTLKKCGVIKQLLLRYEADRKLTLYIKNINLHFKNDFENYCISQGYALNTIARAVRFIKTICNHAKANGVETHFQLDGVKAKYIKVDNIYLNETEIQQIENIESEKLTEGLENDRDWLLISCYCGQRISDFLRFDKSMIRYEKNKSGVLKPLIEFTQVKTGKIMTIPLHHKIIEIVNKYGGEFPRKISDQKYNDNIKIVCKLAEIKKPTHGVKFDPETKNKVEKEYEKWELVSSHIGRRSFASNNYGKIPTSFLMYVTGHTTEAMFLTYIGKSNKDIAMELTNYF